MRKKFKVLVPVVGYVKHEVYAEDESEATDKAFEEEIANGELCPLYPAVKITVEKNRAPMIVEVTEIETDY